MHERTVYSISEITSQIKETLEIQFTGIWVEGEISNFKHHSSGHMYFTVKDNSAELSAVMWRGINQTLRFRPEDGMKVLIRGDITVYPPRGKYQIICQELHPAGTGDLQLAFEQLKARLKDEGLFELERKKSLPDFPLAIGIVTSETGAALQDMLQVLRRRAPYITVTLVDARVQGEGAAEEIVRGIRLLNRLDNLDLIIIGRGGGSLEDLWPFNEEIVARAIVESTLPVVSAVGHEVDFSISDFCADLRAPTPSAAAELIARDRQEIHNNLQTSRRSLRDALKTKIENHQSRLNRIREHYAFRLPQMKVDTAKQRTDELTSDLIAQTAQTFRNRMQRLDSLSKQLRLLHPEQILARGYSITTDDSGDIIRSGTDLEPGEILITQFAEGTAKSKVLESGANTRD